VSASAVDDDDLLESVSAVNGDAFAREPSRIGMDARLAESASVVDGAAFSQAPSCASRVTQTVVDDSGQKPATIDPQEAAARVCRSIRGSPQDADEGPQQDADPGDDPLFHGEKILLMTITRSPREFLEALREGPELEAIIELNKRAGFSCRYEDTHIFVHPKQFLQVMAHINHMEKQMRPYHVIASETYEPLVRLALKRLRSRLDVRPKPTPTSLMTLRRPSDGLPHSIVPDPYGDSKDLLTVQKTFYTISGTRTRQPCVNSSPSASINPRVVPSSGCS